MVPGLTQQLAKQLLVSKGGPKMWDILGNRSIREISFHELWKLIDSHYAVLGNRDTENRKFHEMKQEASEGFATIVNRLRQHSSFVPFVQRCCQNKKKAR